MKVGEDVWKFYQTHLGYSDDEMKKFRQNPRNEDVISRAPALMNKTIVVEVVDSHGCNSQHKVGDKFYFDGSGNLLTNHKCAPLTLPSPRWGEGRVRGRPMESLMKYNREHLCFYKNGS